MGRVLRIFALFALAAAFALTGGRGGAAPAAAQADAQAAEEGQAPDARPNIVFVLTDDLDYGLAQRMPNIGTLLRDEGASFGAAYNSYPLCCPARATILTGLYPHNHGVKDLKGPNGGWRAFRENGHERDNIAVRLQKGGYRTSLFGKYLNGYGGRGRPPAGWDDWRALMGELPYYDYDVNENGRVVHYGRGEGAYKTDVVARHALRFVRDASASGKPFFAYVAPTAPHGPATPARRHKGLFGGEKAPRPPSFDEADVSDKPPWIRKKGHVRAAWLDDLYRKRLGSMMAVDEMVGSITRELEAAGELENTYIFFASDNGYLLGEHRVGHQKRYPYEESARTPLFVRGPGVAPGSTIDELVLNNDYAATWAEIAGVPFERGDGRSLVPLLGGGEGAAPVPWRSQVLLEGFGGEGVPAYAAARTKTHKKYVRYGPGPEELYDLSADPYELESLHGTASYAALKADLKARLEALKVCGGESCRAAEDAP